MRQHVPPQQLWNEFHGDMDFEYDHAVYWPALLKLCQERYSERHERWVKAGKHYGESEIYLRGGNASSLYQSSDDDTAQAPEQETFPGESNEGAAEDKNEDVPIPRYEESTTEEPKAPIQTSGKRNDSHVS